MISDSLTLRKPLLNLLDHALEALEGLIQALGSIAVIILFIHHYCLIVIALVHM